MVNSIRRCENGDDAPDYLHRRGKYADDNAASRPGVILLDLNMPSTDGRDLLIAIKNDAELKKIPVIALTTSADQREFEVCYATGANSYIQNPVDLSGFMDIVRRLKDYWFEIVIFPAREAA